MVPQLPRIIEENLASIADDEQFVIEEDEDTLVTPEDSDLFVIEEDEDDLMIEEDEDALVIEEDEDLEPQETVSVIHCETIKDEHQAMVDKAMKLEPKSWKIIIIDDDPIVHQATQMALKNFKFDGTPLELISAFSAQEGKQIITELNDEAASILLDVVMESNHAGLDLVEFIRESLQNKRVRIILRTGQPGEAPSESVILDYDINDYQLKLDMTRQRLITSLVSALRSYRDLVTIDQQNLLLTETLTKLQQSEQDLKRYSHNLELLVSERTAKLREANEQLKRLASLDGLTQVANRLCFDTRLQSSWQDAIADESHLGLLLIDVDYFKPYNDIYGHLAGDDVLKQVSQALAASLNRSEDLVARYGGEEFGVIIPNANAQACQIIAKRLFQEIAALQIPHRGSSVSDILTISMGVVSLIPQQEIPPESMIEMADTALYHAKKSGRNQYCFYQDLSPEMPL